MGYGVCDATVSGSGLDVWLIDDALPLLEPGIERNLRKRLPLLARMSFNTRLLRRHPRQRSAESSFSPCRPAFPPRLLIYL